MLTCMILSLVVLLQAAATGSPVPQYSIYQYNATNTVSTCNVTVTGPTGSRHRFPLQVFPFSINSTTIAFRVSPDVVGAWNWLISCPSPSPHTATTGTFLCVNATNDAMGGLVLDAHNPGKLRLANGQPFHTIGLEVDWLFALDDQTSTPSLTTFLNDVVDHGVNTLVVSTYSNYSTWNTHLPDRVPPKVSPTQSTPWLKNGSLNYGFFDHWDVVLREAQKRNIQMHVMLYVGNKNVAWPKKLSDLDNLYWRQVLARFNAFSNVIFDVSKEAAGYGVGIKYVVNRLNAIHSMNSHQRLVTAHSGLVWTNACPTAWCHLTMVTAQTHFFNRTAGKWHANMVDLQQRNPGIPVVQAEFMYESGTIRGCNGSAGGDCARNDFDVSTMRKVFWDLYFAGGNGGVWYNCDTAWDVIVAPPLRRPDRSGMMYLRHFSFFWMNVLDAQDKNTLVPSDNAIQSDALVVVHALANNHTIAVHAHHGAMPIVVQTLPRGIVALGGKGVWFDPLTGETSKEVVLVKNGTAGSHTFVPPKDFAAEDIALVVTAKDGL